MKIWLTNKMKQSYTKDQVNGLPTGTAIVTYETWFIKSKMKTDVVGA